MTDQKPAGRRRTPKNPRARRRERIAAAIEALAKVVDRFEEVSLPSPKKFEAIREGRAPWTVEAYLAATARNLHFFLDMVFTLTRDSSPELSALLEDLERRGWTAKAPLERSLR